MFSVHFICIANISLLIPFSFSIARLALLFDMDIPKISVLSPLVTRILGCNPGKFTLQGTNTYLIGKGRKRVLIDSGEGNSEYTNMMAEYAQLLGIEISAILLTHWHGDHVNGVEPMLKHPQLGARINSNAIYKYKLAGDDERYPWDVQPFADNQVFKGDDFTLIGYHTPGHAKDHLVFWLEEEQALFSGDNILGHGTTIFENLKDYVESLRRMQSIIESKVEGSPPIVRTYPAHSHIVSDTCKTIKQYIQHRTDREDEIVNVLSSHHQVNGLDEPLSVGSIVKVIYKDYPEHIWPAAERGVHLHLQKLKTENKVELISDDWKLNH